MRVAVYRNLHKNTYSVKSLEGPNKGRVIFHSDHVTLHNCTPRIWKGTQKKVRDTHRKQVHAFLEGTLVSRSDNPLFDGMPIYYNPYAVDTFSYRHNNDPFIRADYVHLAPSGVWTKNV